MQTIRSVPSSFYRSNLIQQHTPQLEHPARSLAPQSDPRRAGVHNILCRAAPGAGRRAPEPLRSERQAQERAEGRGEGQEVAMSSLPRTHIALQSKRPALLQHVLGLHAGFGDVTTFNVNLLVV
jgi:hypothetical protein